MAFGLTDQGLVVPTTQQIIALLVADMQTDFGPTFALNPISPEGLMVATFADQLANAWAAIEQSYNAFFPDTTTGTSLDNLAGISGLVRLPALKAQLGLRFFMDAPGNFASFNASQMLIHAPGNPSAQFTNSSLVGLLAFSNAETQYVRFHFPGPTDATGAAGNFTLKFGANTTANIAFNGATPATMATATASALNLLASIISAGGVTVLATTMPRNDGTGASDIVLAVTWNTSGVDQAMLQNIANTISPLPVITVTEFRQGGIYVDFPLETYPTLFPAVATGINNVPAGTVMVLDTPANHVLSVVATSCAPGREVESDGALRVRRSQQLQQLSANVAGIIQGLSRVSGVTKVSVVENNTDVADGAGRPPHSFEAIVTGGSAQDVGLAVFTYKAAGIAMFGNTTATVTDSQGLTHVVAFSRPTPVPVYITVTLTTNSNSALGPVFPVGGATSVQAAIVAMGALLQAGQTVTVTAIEAAVMTVPGVFGMVVNLGLAAFPVGTTNLLMAAAQVPTISTDTVVVA